jgi:hypothetical protein
MIRDQSFEDLIAALRAEREATVRLEEARSRVLASLSDSVKAGAQFVSVARVTYKFRVGRSPSVRERLREARRLRKRHERETRRLANRTAVTFVSERSRVGSSGEEVTHMAERLIRRKVVEEEFELDNEKKEPDCDEKASAAEEDEEEDLDEDEEEEDEGDED